MMAQKLTASKRRALREEAREWDQLSDESLARLFDEGKPVHVRLRPPPKDAYGRARCADAEPAPPIE